MTHANPSGRPRVRRWARMVLIVAACAFLVDCGILGDLRANPGYAAFRSPGYRDTDREFALSLGPLPLKLARLITRGDPELSSILRGVKAVRVYTYAVDGDAARVHERIDGIRDGLIEEGWDQVVAVRDDGEVVAALVKLGSDGAIRGMAVVVQDDEEVVLVNLIGDIHPENFSSLMNELDIHLPQLMVMR